MKWGEKYIISSHPCIAIGGFRTIFLELNEYAWESSHATFEDVSKIFVKGKGEILVFLKNRGHEFIPNIYHNPNMKNVQYIKFGSTLRKERWDS